MPKIFAEILLPLALDSHFTYIANESISKGDLVRVEFGKKEIWGVVWNLKNNAPAEIAIDKIKPILAKNLYLKFSENHLKFIDAISAYNLANKGLVLRSFLGSLNSDKSKKEPNPLAQEIDIGKFSLKNLSTKQEEIFSQLKEKKSGISLLDGVTGSGKTEIYFALIAEILGNNLSPENSETPKQILILLPEIALTSQLLLRFEQQFGFKPALWHSKIPTKNKREIFYGIVDGSTQLIIGARSSLLLPFKNLKLIIIDEEHDSSFKQEDSFNFHARDMAILRAEIEKFPVLLCSATPSLESYVNAVSGKFSHFILEQKFGQKNHIHLIDLRQEKIEKNEFLSKKLRDELAQNLINKKQSLLFLNRRGYAPVSLCKYCGQKIQCLDCDFNLVLHKSKNLLICHHCGRHEKPKQICANCGEKDSLIALGIGVEKLEEEVKQLFPEARIALVTSDNIGNFAEIDELVKKILNHEIDIIIGTQMIAKGHDFPDLTLVGIVDADGMLYSSEIRALEKTFQILTQVTGRAGRNKDEGQVLIQTFNPQNFVFEKVQKNDKKSFYNFEISNRRNLDLPPFARMIQLEISSFKEVEAKNFAKKLISNFPASEKIELFGPAPAAIQRLKNRHHFLINLKSEKKINLQKLVLAVIKSEKIPNSVRIRIDVDPV